MNIIKYLLVTIILIFVFFRIGILIKQLFKRKKDDIFNVLLNGFIGSFAIFEIIALPFNLLNLNVKVLYYIEISAFIITITISFILNRKNELKIFREKIKIIQYIKNIDKKELILTIFVIIMIILQMFLSLYLYTSNADDSFYVSWSEQAKQLEQYLNVDPSLGQETSNFDKIYIFNSWEIFNGFAARLLKINVTTLLHTIYPIILILLSYIAYYLLIRRIDKKHSKIMLLVLCWLFLFSGISARYRGYTLLVRIWQGKTILTNIFLPYILYQMLNLKLDLRKIIMLVITNIASMAFNPISIWMFPLLYFFFTLVMFFKKQIKNVFKMIIVIIPNLILLPIYIKLALTGVSGTIHAVEYVEYLYVLKDFIRDGQLFIVLYLISCIYIIFKGNRKSKRLFLLLPMLILLTVLNPLASKYVQKYITTPATYWRLFWLIPIELTIAYATTQLIMNRKNNYIKIIIIFFMFLTIACIGKNIYTSSGEFTKHVNSEKIPPYIIEQTDFILKNSSEKVFVIAPPEPLHGATMRQLSSNIILLYSRLIYKENMDNMEEKLGLYYKIYDGAEKEEIYEAFNNYDIDFIILELSNKEILNDIDNEFAKIVYEDEQYFIIANMKSEKINL